jgi:hypothetical protein
MCFKIDKLQCENVKSSVAHCCDMYIQVHRNVDPIVKDF